MNSESNPKFPQSGASKEHNRKKGIEELLQSMQLGEHNKREKRIDIASSDEEDQEALWEGGLNHELPRRETKPKRTQSTQEAQKSNIVSKSKTNSKQVVIPGDVNVISANNENKLGSSETSIASSDVSNNNNAKPKGRLAKIKNIDKLAEGDENDEEYTLKDAKKGSKNGNKNKKNAQEKLNYNKPAKIYPQKGEEKNAER